jgi:cyclopropane-fatty-acyl-phospholipid synthase
LTARKWLENMDKDPKKALDSLKGTLDDQEAYKWLNRWRVFYMAVEELFGFQGGNTWVVSHYLFSKK